MRGSARSKVAFSGTVTAVKARIRLLRSFDQVSHAYLGYTLVLGGTVDGMVADDLRVAVGPKTHETHRFRIMDQLQGVAEPVPDPDQEWATHYRASELRLLQRGPAEQDIPAHPEGGIAVNSRPMGTTGRRLMGTTIS